MPQILNCPHCKKPVQVPDGAGGKQMKCPTCQKMFVAPAPPRGGAAGAAPVKVGAAAGAAGGGGPSSSASGEFALPSVPPSGGGGGGGEKCKVCGVQLLPGAICCMDCGAMVAGAEDDGAAAGEQVIVCNNPACMAANPPTQRNCIRCENVLPTPPGTMIKNRYKIEKQLAVGGFGAVYLAVDAKAANKQVAIKDMICSDPQEFTIRLNFFRREMEILKALEKCPIVPRIYELIEDGDKAHLIMEFIKGKDLLKRMEADNNKPFTVDQAVEWGKSICDVLNVMHTQNPPLIHRDLKPDNVMLMEDNRTIKMIDFGTARDIGKSAKERQKGVTRVYTEGYAPPEQIIGKPEPRSDLFALAGTLFHLITGRCPEGTFTAKELEEQLAGQKGGVPAQYRWFYELLKINLAEDVNDRYFSAKEFKQDLEKKQVTKEIKCVKCSAANQVRTPYCVKCAAPLTDVSVACNQCGKNNMMGSKFCIYCGNRLR